MNTKMVVIEITIMATKIIRRTIMGSFIKTIDQLKKTAGAKTIFFDAEMLTVFWETDPELIAKVLPKDMTPGKDPIVRAFIADYPRTSFCPPYKEAGLFIPAVRDGVEGDYCLSMPISDGQAMAMGRENMGLPKKMADIQLSVEDDKFKGSIARNGITFFKIEGDIGADTNEPEAQEAILKAGAGTMTLLHIKYARASDGNGYDMDPVLYANDLEPEIKVIKPVKVEMELTDSPHDPWAELKPTKMLGAVYTVGDNTLNKGKKLCMIDQATFAPYSFTRWDWWIKD